ncbi:MAG: S1/P1 nuclease [Gammaproteobacteria bacterium]|nr:S1/P1 nuclease [Gammaproteobacteria bacterium]
MNRSVLLTVVLVAAFVLLGMQPQVAYAWGKNGHRITAKLGEDRLSPKAHAAVRALAGTKSLALLSNWADFIRSDPAWDCIKPMHYVTVDDDETLEQGMAKPAYLSRACNGELFKTLNMPNNIVSAIDYFAEIVAGDPAKAADFAALLADSGATPLDNSIRLTALALLVHFVGDIHQPLHVGRSDLGANVISVQWFGELTNLHTVWDTELIEFQQLSYTEFTAFLEQEFANKKGLGLGLGPVTWAHESIAHRVQVYDAGDDGHPQANLPRLSYEYAAAQNALLNRRLYSGGTRLGQLLNSIFE